MLTKEIIFFIVPVLLAGTIHHFFVIGRNLFSPLAVPLDFGLTISGQSVFGRSKTWRGLIIMTMLTAIFMWLASFFIHLALFYNIFLTGLVIGLGYSLGELPTSFIKRRLNIPPSQSNYKSWHKILYIIDQIDSVIGAVLALIIIYNPSAILIFFILAIGTILHMLIDWLLYNFGYKNIKGSVVKNR